MEEKYKVGIKEVSAPHLTLAMYTGFLKLLDAILSFDKIDLNFANQYITHPYTFAWYLPWTLFALDFGVNEMRGRPSLTARAIENFYYKIKQKI